jgi:membrane protein DedA with SNARE-associated domain
MDGLDLFLETYGLLAACAVLLVKSVGVPVPVPGDVILLATAARAAEGKVLLWLAFIALLVVLTVGGTIQYLLARGPARRVVFRYGRRLGVTEQRLERVTAQIRRGGLLAIGLAVLTPGVRTAAIPACGLASIPLRLFVPGLMLGTAIDLALHFALGYFGVGVLSVVLQSAPLLILVALLAVGFVVWLVIARRRKTSAFDGWAQATCPVCLAVATVSPAGI